MDLIKAYSSRADAFRATDELQPNDSAVFGTMKATCRRVFRKHIADGPMIAVNHQVSVQFLIRTREQVSFAVLTRMVLVPRM
jgi:hypothetical protein